MNNNNINLKPTEKMGYINFWCQKVIPLVFDDSLSYYEAICKFMQKLNEVISALNNNAECIDELQGKYIILQNNFNALEDKWEEFKTYIENKFNTCMSNLINNLANGITNLDDEYELTLTDLNNEIEEKEKELSSLLKDLVGDEDDLKAFNEFINQLGGDTNE